MNHSANPPSHPELLEILADELVASKFNVRHFLRELALSETYQRSSQIGDARESAPQSFAVFNMKPLSAEQLAFSLMRATGNEQRVMTTPADKAATAKYRPDKGRPIPAENIDNVLKLFRSVYAAQPGRAEDDFVPSVAAALFAENEGLLLRWLTPAPGNLVNRLSKLKKADAIAEELYSSILTRRPTDEERAAVVRYLDGTDGRESLLREMAWALFASSEFRFNH